MLEYREKLLELKSIYSESDNYFLKVRLSFGQDTEMIWQIDEYTAKSLQSIAQFDDKCKYRLSLNSHNNSNQNSYKGILTKTYLDQSNSFYFLCSEKYVNDLAAIKDCQDISELDKNTFSFINLTIHGYIDGDKKESSELNTHKSFIADLRQNFIPTVGIIMATILIFLGCIYIKLYEKALAQPIQLDSEVQIVEQNIEPNKNEVIQEAGLNDKIDIGQNTLLESKVYAAEETPLSIEADIPAFELKDMITYSLPEGYVALTFDDGPSEHSLSIMKILEQYGVGGTFFFTGYNVNKYPDYIQSIYSSGYSIGSHSISHTDMANISYEDQERELVQSIDSLESIVNNEVVLFRPPYGSYNQNLKSLLTDNQYKMVLWNNDPKDWKTRDAVKIYNNIKNSNVSGSIIVLHECQATVDALPSIIEYLKELNLKIVSLK